MDDYLLDLSKRPWLGALAESAGLPVPPRLPRRRSPWRERELTRQSLAIWSTPESRVLERLVRTCLDNGAELSLDRRSAASEALSSFAESRGTSISRYATDGTPAGDFDGLILDATEFSETEDLDRLYDLFQPKLEDLEDNGCVVVLGRPPEVAGSPESAAVQRGLDGFIKSLAKELGAYGSNVHLVRVDEGAAERLGGPLTFLLTPRSSYISGQSVRVDRSAASTGAAAGRRQTLEGKTALVTGAARGIGASIAEALAREGARVLCVDLPDSDELQTVARKVGGEAVALDITEGRAPAELAERADTKGGIDILVHNAGITRDRTLARMRRSAWRDSLNVNLESPLRLTEALEEGDALNDGGRILCLSSVTGIAGNRGQTNYSTGKAGLIGWVTRLADRYADRGITANAVAPGFIETAMTREMPAAIREVARRMNVFRQAGRPDDVAEAVAFLAAPFAQGINGDVLRVCGGAWLGE